MLRSKTETPKPAYEGGPIDELYKAYAMHESGGSLTSYNFTEADIEADAACSAFDDADEDTATKAYEINHAARRAGYFAGWKHAALFFMDIMRLLDADMDGITKREAKACKEARGTK